MLLLTVPKFFCHMETVLDLLKDAVHEEEDEIRLNSVTKACSIISKLLPFERKRSFLIKEPKLIQFLLLCIPFLGKTIQILLKEIISVFSSNSIFLIHFWSALHFITELSESVENPVPRALTRQNSLLRIEYCTDLLTKKGSIKAKVLVFCHHVLKILQVNYLFLFPTFAIN